MDPLGEYVNAQVRTATARNLVQLGFAQANASSIDALSDITVLYLRQLVRRVQMLAECSGRSKPALHDVMGAFSEMKISRFEIYEYMRQVLSVEAYEKAPVFPVPMTKFIHPISVNSPPKETTPIKMEQRSVSDSYVVAPGLTPLPDFSQASAHSLGFVRHSTSPSTFTSQPEKEEKPSSSCSTTRQYIRSRPSKRRHGRKSKRPSVSSSSTAVHSSSETAVDVNKVTPFNACGAEPDNQAFTVEQTTKGEEASAKDGSSASVHQSASETSRDVVKGNLVRVNAVMMDAMPLVVGDKRATEAHKVLITEGSDVCKSEALKEDAPHPRVPPLRIRLTDQGPVVVNQTNSLPRLALIIKKSLLVAALASQKPAKTVQSRPTKEHRRHHELQLSSSRTYEKTGAAKRQEASRCKKSSQTFPYLASDLMKNSYAVLTACMAGRAFPIVPSSLDEEMRCSEDHISTLNAVDEVIWRDLSAMCGITPHKRQVLCRNQARSSREGLQGASSDCVSFSDNEILHQREFGQHHRDQGIREQTHENV